MSSQSYPCPCIWWELGHNDDDAGFNRQAVQEDFYLPVILRTGQAIISSRNLELPGSLRILSFSFNRGFPKKKMGSTMLQPFPYVSCLLLKAFPPPYVNLQRSGGFDVSYCCLLFGHLSIVRDWMCFGERRVKIVISYIYCVFQPQPVRPWEQRQRLQPHPGRAREALEITQR